MPGSEHQWRIERWMTADAVTRVLRALGALDGPKERVDVRFVGGAVRNTVMGLPVGEIDLATPEIPTKVIYRLDSAGLKAVPTGLDHGTVLALAAGETFEITTLRRDTACDGRHAAVEFTTDWHEDARRRDFTINAMSLRPDGMLFDDHGGVEDAKAGRVGFVGAPVDRIQEDYLRILRLFRFYAWYGRAPLDAPTLAACRAHADGLARLSGERIKQELAKLLLAPTPLEALALMVDAGVLARIVTGAGDLRAIKRLVAIEQDERQREPDWLRRLAAILPPAADADEIADSLRLSNADRERLAALTKVEPVLDEHADPLRLRRALYRLGAPLLTDRLLLAWSRANDGEHAAPWRALLAASAAWVPKVLPVAGADVLALGVKSGPAVGRLLAAVEEWWIGASFEPCREGTLAHLERLVNQAGAQAPEH